MFKYLLGFSLVVFSAFAGPKAVVFDFGGVMTGPPNREAVIDFLKESFELSDEEYRATNEEKRAAIQRGPTDREFWLSFGRDRGFETKGFEERFDEVLKTAIGTDLKMYALVEELKAKTTVALLSNIDDRYAKIVRHLGLYEPFDPCLLSCDLGVEKPDPEIYRKLLAVLNVSPQDIVFIDDLKENVLGASAIGLDAILFESEEQIRKELLARDLP